MTDFTYEIVEHDGGWAYRADGVYSETFPSHDEALVAARIAAARQQVGGEDEEILSEDERGGWREEFAAGGDRPQTHVKG
jgi:hypothetical protein